MFQMDSEKRIGKAVQASQEELAELLTNVRFSFIYALLPQVLDGLLQNTFVLGWRRLHQHRKKI